MTQATDNMEHDAGPGDAAAGPPGRGAGSARLAALAAAIVAAYVKRSAVPAGEVSGLFDEVHATLARLAALPATAPVPEARRPAVPIHRSVTADHIVCLEDGLAFKSLKRHLRARYNMTPDQYRTRWGLPDDYPLVAPGYARERSQLAKLTGLGQQRRRKLS